MEEIKHTPGRNPYAPPEATVADVVQPETRGPRPTTVSWAVGLFWVDLGVGVVDTFLSWPPDWLSVAPVWVLSAFEAWVIWKISVGRNWARWVALLWVTFAVSLILLALGRGTLIVRSHTAVSDALSILVDGVALYLLFVSSGRRWFARRA
jgi:hypothetical protein